MPVTNIYDERTLRQVTVSHPVSTTVKFVYLFRSNVPTTEVTELGQEEISGVVSFLSPAIFATSHPKPLIAKNSVKRISSFCSTASFPTARAAGWTKLHDAKFMQERTQTTTGFTATSTGSVIARVDCKSGSQKFSYGWRMNARQLFRISPATLTALGISFPTTEADWRGLVMGCDSPKPPRASASFTAGTSNLAAGGSGKVDTVTTFYDSTKTLPTGWSQTENGTELIV
ncbi:MAG: hypothetical protein VKK42_19575 [Lyngbya sp.]|nr:hypothetical protein [Lyngbya sp.]